MKQVVMAEPVQHEDQAVLRPGDWVEVRSAEEIFATLDDGARLEALPFMPEMLRFCGKRFKVFKSAHKTCDTIQTYKGRRMENAVHLEGSRCDGQAHGGCQAECLLFWKVVWLKPASGPNHPESGSAPPRQTFNSDRGGEAGRGCNAETLERATRRPAGAGASEGASVGSGAETRYSCQATEVLNATTPLPWWKPDQYWKDLRSGNVRLGTMIPYMLLNLLNNFLLKFWRGKAWVHPFPYLRGRAGKKTPHDVLDLQPGELVQVRSKKEIMRTLDAKLRNRGLSFDCEAASYCGKTARVRSRVSRIINEKTGAMMELPNTCIILDGVTCTGCYSTHRLFCPRNLYPFWREIWLKRVD